MTHSPVTAGIGIVWVAVLGVAIAPAGGGAPLERAGGSPERAPLAHTGGFGEPTCVECHSDGPLNDRGGSLTLQGVPWRYQPGEIYRISVRLVRAGLGNGGFQLSARISAGTRAGSQAGRLANVDERVSVADTTRAGGTPVTYARHTREGTHRWVADTLEWTVSWTAPAAGAGAVIFHAAANAGNDDNSPMGDYVYTTGAAATPDNRSRNKSD